MARRHRRPPADYEQILSPLDTRCPLCSGPAPVAYHSHRTVATRDGLGRLTLVVRRYRDTACPLHPPPYRPDEEGAIALPHGEVGLDLLALVGTLRFAQHRTVPEIHAELRERGIAIAARSVTNLVQR